MKYYECDMCGQRIQPKELRYVVKMSIYAAYDTLEIELTDLERDYTEEIRSLIRKMEHMDPKELQEDVFKEFCFDLCRECQQKLVRSPLGRKSSGEAHPSGLPPFDVDDFLRQLGSG
ncbi:MAG: hypothetical protein HY801_05450 [Candidatus Lindowbacteria bacterium]|nr:hypothetical protein [Candidatus Lindowbacteria bacterium]